MQRSVVTKVGYCLLAASFFIILISRLWDRVQFTENSYERHHSDQNIKRISPDPVNELDKTMQIYIMTKNEWPIIKSNILYHGTIFGFGNLYVIDASTDPLVLAFLRAAQVKLGVNVIYSISNLNSVEEEMNMIMRNEKNKTDFLIKLDTDEIVVHYDQKETKMSTNPTIIRNYLNMMPFDGGKLNIGYSAFAMVSPSNCSENDNTFITSHRNTEFADLINTTYKAFFASKTFGFYDLGGHKGSVHASCKVTTSHTTNLGIMHYHYHCFERSIKADEQAVLSHNYIFATDTLQLKIEKMTNLTVDFPAQCYVLSCHKVFSYLQYLLNPENAKTNYYANLNKVTYENPEISNKMIELEAEYKWVV